MEESVEIRHAVLTLNVESANKDMNAALMELDAIKHHVNQTAKEKNVVMMDAVAHAEHVMKQMDTCALHQLENACLLEPATTLNQSAHIR